MTGRSENQSVQAAGCQINDPEGPDRKNRKKTMQNRCQIDKLNAIARMIRSFILTSTTNAGSGHPTSALSAVELMAGLFFGGIFRFDPDQPDHPNNDRIIFSNGHATPLFYALWAAAETARLITVKDHYAEGGIADAVRSALTAEPAAVYSLAIRKNP
jgi:deoxyxylulose-5-phosphate synthase